MCACQEFITSFKPDSNQQQGLGMGLVEDCLLTWKSPICPSRRCPPLHPWPAACLAVVGSIECHCPTTSLSMSTCPTDYADGSTWEEWMWPWNYWNCKHKYTGRKFQEPQKLDTLLHPLSVSNFLLSNFFFLYQDSLQLISLNLRTTHVKLYPQNKASSQILP